MAEGGAAGDTAQKGREGHWWPTLREINPPVGSEVTGSQSGGKG